MTRFISLIVIVGLLSSVANAQPVDMIEHRVWNKTPIHIVLPVGLERRIDFPLPIKIQVPNHVKQSSDRIQVSESGSVYWVASKSFERQRVNVITETGYSYLLDIEARAKGHVHPIAIVDHRIPGSTGQQSIGAGSKHPYDYVDLVRYASQKLYAPKRLIKPLPGVQRMPVQQLPIPLVRGGDLQTIPLAQWVASTVPSLYVTAVQVKSVGNVTAVLDPRLIRGDFLAASSQHSQVSPPGSAGDTTTWYLVSRQPFDEVAPSSIVTTPAEHDSVEGNTTVNHGGNR